MREKVRVPPFAAEKAIRPQGLHQTLREGEEEEIPELLPAVGRPGQIVKVSQECRTIFLDVALEAARSYLKQRGASPSELMEYAKLCKVERLGTPYIEAMVP